MSLAFVALVMLVNTLTTQAKDVQFTPTDWLTPDFRSNDEASLGDPCVQSNNYAYSRRVRKETGLRFCRRYNDKTCCQPKEAEFASNLALPYFQETILPLAPLFAAFAREMLSVIPSFIADSNAIESDPKEQALIQPLSPALLPSFSSISGFSFPDSVFLEKKAVKPPSLPTTASIAPTLPTAVSGFAFWRDLPPLCRSLMEEMACSSCSPDVGAGLSSGVCISSCSIWYQACKNVLYAPAATLDDMVKPCPSQAFSRSATNTDMITDEDLLDGEEGFAYTEVYTHSLSGSILKTMSSHFDVHQEPLFCSPLSTIFNKNDNTSMRMYDSADSDDSMDKSPFSSHNLALGKQFCASQKIPTSDFVFRGIENQTNNHSSSTGACFEPPSLYALKRFLTLHDVSVEQVLKFDQSQNPDVFPPTTRAHLWAQASTLRQRVPFFSIFGSLLQKPLALSALGLQDRELSYLRVHFPSFYESFMALLAEMDDEFGMNFDSNSIPYYDKTSVQAVESLSAILFRKFEASEKATRGDVGGKDVKKVDSMLASIASMFSTKASEKGGEELGVESAFLAIGHAGLGDLSARQGENSAFYDVFGSGMAEFDDLNVVESEKKERKRRDKNREREKGRYTPPGYEYPDENARVTGVWERATRGYAWFVRLFSNIFLNYRQYATSYVLKETIHCTCLTHYITRHFFLLPRNISSFVLFFSFYYYFLLSTG